MAHAAQQIGDLENLLDGLDGIDELDALDFETEEVVAVDENEVLAVAQQELEPEEAVADDLEELLADEAEVEAETESEVEAEADDELDMEAVEAEVKAEERQRKLDEATMSDEEAEEAKSKLVAPEAKAKPKASTAKSEPKDAIDCEDVLNSKVSPQDEHWALLDGVNSEDMRTEILSAAESLPKKTREKVVNLMDWWVRGHNLSVYTKIGFELLIEEGSISGPALRNRYMSNPGKAYTMGTANAQSGQIVRLFKTFKITTSDGQIDPDHEMVKRFSAVHGA